MFDSILIFEDEFQHNLNPLSYTRPVYDLRCGILTLQKKIEKRFVTKNILLHTRQYLTDFVKRNNPQVLVNEINDQIKNLLINY